MRDKSSNLSSLNSVRSTLDPATHTECLEFIRVAIAEVDRQTAQDIAAILKEVCDAGYADRTQLWADLTPDEQAAFTGLLK